MSIISYCKVNMKYFWPCTALDLLISQVHIYVKNKILSNVLTKIKIKTKDSETLNNHSTLNEYEESKNLKMLLEDIISQLFSGVHSKIDFRTWLEDKIIEFGKKAREEIEIYR